MAGHRREVQDNYPCDYPVRRYLPDPSPALPPLPPAGRQLQLHQVVFRLYKRSAEQGNINSLLLLGEYYGPPLLLLPQLLKNTVIGCCCCCCCY